MKDKKKFSWGRFLLKIFLYFLLALILFIAVQIPVSLLDRRGPSSVMPAGGQAYLQIDSTEKLLNGLLDLEAGDIILSSPELGTLREQITSLRRGALLKNRWIQYLLRLEVLIGLYEEESLLAVADLGIRSFPLRAATPLFKRLPFRIRGLEVLNTRGYMALQYQGDDPDNPDEKLPPVYLAYRGDLILFSNDYSSIIRAFSSEDMIEHRPALKESLSQTSEEEIKVLVRTESFVGAMRDGTSLEAQILSALEFPDYGELIFRVDRDEVALNLSLPVESSSEGLSRILSQNSGVPAIVSELPEGVEYATLLALGNPGELLDGLSPLLPPDILESLEQAEKAANFALKMDLEEMLYSWMGREWGLYGLEDFPEPVFFVRVADEKRRQDVFRSLFSRFFLKEDDSLVIGDYRIRQMSLPWYLRGILEALKVELPKPYFLVYNDFIYFSTSAEVLAESVGRMDQGRKMVQTEDWQNYGASIPASASMELFYSLNRSLPFFLAGEGAAVEALKLYNRGIATLRFEGNQTILSLSARADGNRGILPYPGFPLQRQESLSGTVTALSPPGEEPRLYWLENQTRLVEYQPATGEFTEAELDDQAWLIADPEQSSLWAVSKRGAVYRYEKGLRHSQGYPLLTGLQPTSAPVLSGDSLLIPRKENNSIVRLSDGVVKELARFDSPLITGISTSREGDTAVYPKSFLGQLYLLDPEGVVRPGWPQEVSGISLGAPQILTEGEDFSVAFLSQAGTLTLFSRRGSIEGEWELEDVFYHSPTWAPLEGKIYTLSEKGELYRVDPRGEVIHKAVEGVSGKEAELTLYDLDGDGSEEIFISRAGGVLYGLDSSLEPLEGFPLTGGLDPDFADLNGDGYPEIITAGYDKTLRAYRYR